MESHIWHKLASSVTLCKKGSEKGQWPLPAPLSQLLLFSQTLQFLPVCHGACLSSCYPSAGTWSESKSWFFEGNFLGLQKFLPPIQSLLVFAARSYGDLTSLALGPWAGGPGVRLGLLAPEIPLPNFYPPHMGMFRQPILHLCPSHQPGWMWFL